MQIFDVLAAVVFAVSGALVAARRGMAVMVFMWFAVITGVGGGTVRDLILDVPVFWVQQPVYVVGCPAIGGSLRGWEMGEVPGGEGPAGAP